MIVFGILTTPDVAIEGMTLAAGAFDCTLADISLLHRHERPIGKVLGLFYRGDKLHVIAETDDPVALKADFLSPGFRVIEHRDGRVLRARLEEVSLTGDPVNPHCRVLERKQNDPLIGLWRNRLAQLDLTVRRVEWLKRYVEAIPAALAAMAPAPKETNDSVMTKPATSFGSLVAELNSRSE